MSDLYDEDIRLWSERQSELLCRSPQDVFRGLPTKANQMLTDLSTHFSPTTE